MGCMCCVFKYDICDTFEEDLRLYHSGLLSVHNFAIQKSFALPVYSRF